VVDIWYIYRSVVFEGIWLQMIMVGTGHYLKLVKAKDKFRVVLPWILQVRSPKIEIL